MRASSSANSPATHKSSRKHCHPYEVVFPSIGSWLSDSSEDSPESADGSMVSDDERAIHDLLNPIPPPPTRLILYPIPVETLLMPLDEQGFPTYAQYIAVEAAYLNGHSPSRRAKILLNHQAMCEVARVLVDFLVGVQGSEASNSGLMSTANMRQWAHSKFTLSKDGVVMCQGKPLLAREQLYRALCWAHAKSGHGGRDRTARVMRKYAGVPKQLIMYFVAACPTCATKKPNVNAKQATNKNKTSHSLPPLREVLASIQVAGSTHTALRRPSEDRALQYDEYAGVSIPRPTSSTNVAPPDESFSLQLPVTHDCLPAYLTLGHGTMTQEWDGLRAVTNSVYSEGTLDAHRLRLPLSDFEMHSHDSSLHEEDVGSPSSYGSLETCGYSPLERVAATRGEDYSFGSSDSASPDSSIVSSAPSPAGSPSSVHGGFSGWSPSSPSFTPLQSPFLASPEPDTDTSSRLYNTPLRRFEDRNFQQRLDAMYSTVDVSHLYPATQTHAPATQWQGRSMASDALMGEIRFFPTPDELAASSLTKRRPVYVQSAVLRSSARDAESKKPVNRMHALSTSLGLEIQTDITTLEAPTPPLSATSAPSLKSPATPGLAALSIRSPVHVAPRKDSIYGASAEVKAKPADRGTDVDWNAGVPAEPDFLPLHNALIEWQEWATMGYVCTVEELDGEEHGISGHASSAARA